jgi:HlyD family secretion protein
MDGMLGWVAGLLAGLGLGAPAPPVFPGYVDADYVYVGPVTPGRIETLAVAAGQSVAKGDLLFTQATESSEIALRAATAEAAAAEANWQNLTTGARPEEVAVAEAAVRKAEAAVTLAQQVLDRDKKLPAGAAREVRLDQDQASLDTATAERDAARAQLEVVKLPARASQQQAAEASLEAARARADEARRQLAERTVRAPVGGRIEHTYYRPGEVAAAGAVVVSIVPMGALKVEFYVGEAERLRIQPGDTIRITCDGCAAGLTGKVRFLAATPQYTAPIIYSREERKQLVYLAEAGLDAPGGLLPGQPVTVELGP